MNHKWIKQELQDDDKSAYVSNRDYCQTCGCTRTTQFFKIGDYYQKSYIYMRSGILHGENRPDCIDWDVEDKKTID